MNSTLKLSQRDAQGKSMEKASRRGLMHLPADRTYVLHFREHKCSQIVWDFLGSHKAAQYVDKMCAHYL